MSYPKQYPPAVRTSPSSAIAQLSCIRCYEDVVIYKYIFWYMVDVMAENKHERGEKSFKFFKISLLFRNVHSKKIVRK